ncbi:MAG: DNA-3-methyladenine glycosylase family protein [Pseudomonadota bacterium]
MDAWVKPGMTPTSMVQFLNTQSDLAAALAQLVQADPRLVPVLDKAGEPALRRGEPGFPGLARIICGQQLSTASARAIWGRLQAAFDPFHHDALRRARADRLGRLGLSAAKIRSIKTIATALATGALDLDHIAQSDADTAHAALIEMDGIGPWTADIYLLFCLGHADAWPAGDLALQEAARIALGLKARPSTKEMTAIADAWRPWRGVAAHLLWGYYHVVKRREGVAVESKPKPASKPAARNVKRKVTRNGRTKRPGAVRTKP